jgi:DNA-directed RNA polymerase-3 subunit RPC5
MDLDENDELVSVLPIHFSDALATNLQIHQFPLLTRSLQAPPSAVLSGKRITARIKPETRRLEIHVPMDTRREVYNSEKSKELGAGRVEDDREKDQEGTERYRDNEASRLSEVRLRSEEIPHRGAHVLGIIRDGSFVNSIILCPLAHFIPGKLHLHPINETHQFRPTLTYLDVLSRKSRRPRGAGSDSDSDDGPPPDPDEVAPVVIPKKEKKAGDAKEVHVSARKSEDQSGPGQSGLSAVRREMLHIIRTEEDEKWEDLEFCDVMVGILHGMFLVF